MFEYGRPQKIVLGVLALVALSGVGVQAWRALRRPEPVVVVTQPSSYLSGAAAGASIGSGGKGRAILVHVAGAVRRPDVYEFREGDRVRDAIKRAGGALPNSDLNAVNLAAKLTDGQQVYVPVVGEAVRRTQADAATAGQRAVGSGRTSTARRSTKKLTSPSEGTVNINTADSETLQRLPGVGPATAQRIIEYRERKGRFSAREELMEVRGIGPKKFAKMKALVRVQ